MSIDMYDTITAESEAYEAEYWSMIQMEFDNEMYYLKLEVERIDYEIEYEKYLNIAKSHQMMTSIVA